MGNLLVLSMGYSLLIILLIDFSLKSNQLSALLLWQSDCTGFRLHPQLIFCSYDFLKNPSKSSHLCVSTPLTLPGWIHLWFSIHSHFSVSMPPKESFSLLYLLRSSWQARGNIPPSFFFLLHWKFYSVSIIGIFYFFSF